MMLLFILDKLAPAVSIDRSANAAIPKAYIPFYIHDWKFIDLWALPWPPLIYNDIPVCEAIPFLIINCFK